jgi:apolipoprotein D and lipocalin family protein
MCLMLALALAATTFANDAPLKTVDFVDLNKYTGKWYEIARYENRFQKKCTANVTAEYTRKSNGDIEVINSCKKADGSMMDAKGKAKIVDKNTNAKLKVSFFWIFYGKYWVIDLDKDYRYAVVSEPGRNYLWILSRTPQLDSATYDGIVSRLQKNGFDTSKLKRTEQK